MIVSIYKVQLKFLLSLVQSLSMLVAEAIVIIDRQCCFDYQLI